MVRAYMQRHFNIILSDNVTFTVMNVRNNRITWEERLEFSKIPNVKNLKIRRYIPASGMLAELYE